MPRNKRLHFKDLDGMRFAAFLPVFLFCFLTVIGQNLEDYLVDLSKLAGLLAQSSLDFFFFLSSFLLTSQGLREYKYLESFSLKNYLIRRALRFGVPLILLLAFIFFGHPKLVQMLQLHEISTPSVKDYIILIPNYLEKHPAFIYIIIAWTIYMMIQFNIIWGLVLRYFKPRIFTVSLIFIIIGTVARMTHYFAETNWHFDTLCYFSSIGIGAILAYLIRTDSPIIEKIKVMNKRKNSIVYSIGICTLLIYLASGEGLFTAFVPLFSGLFFMYMIIEQTYGKNSLFKFRDYKLFSHLGKISYGFIVYQSIVNVLMIIAVESLDLDLTSDLMKLVCFGGSFVLSWIIADVSSSLLERPLHVFRKEFKKL